MTNMKHFPFDYNRRCWVDWTGHGLYFPLPGFSHLSVTINNLQQGSFSPSCCSARIFLLLHHVMSVSHLFPFPQTHVIFFLPNSIFSALCWWSGTFSFHWRWMFGQQMMWPIDVLTVGRMMAVEEGGGRGRMDLWSSSLPPLYALIICFWLRH